jgi:hypothetical protein
MKAMERGGERLMTAGPLDLPVLGASWSYDFLGICVRNSFYV